MKIALIGPTNIDLMSSVSGIQKDIYLNSAKILGELIAKYNHEIVLVPDRGVAVEGLKAYKNAKGHNVIAIVPNDKGTEYQQKTLKINDHLKDCHEIVSNITWCEQHSTICELSDIMVCCGISCGTISEIAWTKWVEKPITYVCRDTVTGIPPEMLAEAHVEFISTAYNFEDILKKTIQP